MTLTREEIENWFYHPVTIEFFNELEKRKDSLVERVSEGECFNKALPVDVVYARETGKIEILKALLVKHSIWSEEDD